MDISRCAALILAAGKGTRMHSPKPKVLQSMLGSPILAYVYKALEPIFAENIFTVAGHGHEQVSSAMPLAKLVIQKEQLGTGHALLCAMPVLGEYEYILVVNGDAPLLQTEILENFIQKADGCDVAFASIILDEPGAYGRVLRKDGKIAGIVEARDMKTDASTANEVNAGIYLLRVKALDALLPQMGNNNKSGEYYITDLVGLGIARNLDVRAIECGRDESLLGVNSPRELTALETIMKTRIMESHLDAGVIIHEPEQTRIGPFAQIEPGAEIYGPCEIYGSSQIKSGACIYSHTVINATTIGKNAQINSFSHLDCARVAENAIVGPYARLRPEAVIEENAHVGNFVELKKTTLGKGAKANHLSYLGDSEIGANVNIGAGTITCNYDGKHKYRTKIGESAFIGSNTSLVAPVEIGENALIGAGSVITKDVPCDELGIARSKQKNLPRKHIDNKNDEGS